MKIDKLALYNFRGFESLELTPKEGKALVVTGPNGSGKSSILNAIEFLLTGNNPTGQKKRDGLLRAGAKRGEVQAIINGQQVARDIDTGTINLDSATAKGKDAQQGLMDLAKMGNVADVSRALRPDLFLQLKTDEQNAVWSALLEMRVDPDLIDREVAQIGKTAVAVYKEFFPRTSTNFQTNYKAFYGERTISKRTLKEAEVVLAKKNKEREDGAAPEFAKMPDPDAKRYGEIEHRNLLRKLGGIEQREADRAERAKSIEKLKALVVGLWSDTDREKLEQRIKKIDQKLDALRPLAIRGMAIDKQLNELRSTACPTCKRDWDNLEDRQAKVEELEVERAEIDVTLDTHTDLQKLKEQGLALRRTQHELLESKKLLDSLLAEPELEAESKEKLEAKLAEYSSLLAQLEEEERAAKAYAYWQAEFTQLSDAVAAGKKRVEALEALVLLFGKTAAGLQARILRKAAGEIEAQLTGVLANWDMAARLDDNLALELKRDSTWRPVASCSDGERIVVAIALQTWLADQAKTGLILIDRLEALDSDNQKIALGAIEDLLTSGSITHAFVAGVGLAEADLILGGKHE